MSGGNVPDSSETDPLAAGSYSYQAVYSGDNNYATSTGPCEPFKIAQASSSTDTVVKDHGGNVVDAANPAALGSQVHDTATVTSGNDSFTPSGTVTYHLYSGLECNVDNAIGDPETVTMSGGNVPDSSETDPLAAGSYSYQAVYSGDNNYRRLDRTLRTVQDRAGVLEHRHGGQGPWRERGRRGEPGCVGFAGA